MTVDGLSPAVRTTKVALGKNVPSNAAPLRSALAPSICLVKCNPWQLPSVNPTDHERLGFAERAQAKVTSSRTTFLVDAVADPAVARGVAVLPFNQHGVRATDLIDATAAVTDVRVETP